MEKQLFCLISRTVGDDKFKVSQESLAMSLKESEIAVAKSMLEVLGFKQSADNLRTRYVYEKEGVKFEIDEYIRPKMNVIGIEGEKEKVDEIYKFLNENERIKDFIVK